MEKKRLKRRSIIIAIFFVIVLFIFTFNVTSSRYIGQLESKGNDINAIPILTLQNPTFDIPLSMIPGESFESDFIVTNYEAEKVNEILMNYYIQVPTDLEIPLTITITDSEQQELPLNGEGKTEDQTLIYGIKTDDTYHLKIEWEPQNNNYEYAGKTVNFTLNVVGTQSEGA